MKMKNLFSVGDNIYGFCNGAFGRDDYDDKLCILVNNRFAVFQYTNGEFEGNAVVLNHPDRWDLETVDQWKEELVEFDEDY
tara:strand:+ start:594 stop:836 length:243 start_codon:yes stop_codon:yes gene_type:complete